MKILENKIEFARFVMDMAAFDIGSDCSEVMKRYLSELSRETALKVLQTFHILAAYIMYDFLKSINYSSPYSDYITGLNRNYIEGVAVDNIPEFVASELLLLMRYAPVVKNNEKDRKLLLKFMKKVVDPRVKHFRTAPLCIYVCYRCGKIFVQRRATMIYCSKQCSGQAKSARYRAKLKGKRLENNITE